MAEEIKRGHLHPISSLIREANAIFMQMGFTFAEGPLVEDEVHNFDMLNVPKDHPARDMQDTFFMKGEPGAVLRTHTSPVQVRYMEAQIKKGVKPPYRVIVPGKVFRNEATDMTHEAEFFQIEGLAVGEDVSLAQLKGTLEHFFKALFKDASVEIRFRPSFFPFTEPSAEIDVAFMNGPMEGRWLEIGGCGMVHPNVLRNGGVDPERYTGFAFGMGPDRLTMLRYGIDDLRLFYDGDLRFLAQFS